MNCIVMNIEWVLIVSGALTCSMIIPMISPRIAFKYMFGEEADGPLGLLLMRHWGQMIFATGLLLVFSAFYEESRLPILAFASFTKLTFVVLVTSNGMRYMRKPVMLIALGDLTMVMLFVWYLLTGNV
jgi:hypothetical protein